jgi:Cu2+-exporting ATPase
LAVPAAITRCLAALARRGVLVVQPDAIEALAGATHVVFDKTGTLTDRRLALERVQVLSPGLTPDQALRLAAVLARESRHPASQAIAAAAAQSTAGASVTAGIVAADPPVSAPAVAAVATVAGAGVEATVDGRRLRLGRADFSLRGAAIPAGHEADVVLADESGPLAAFALGEQLRAGARSALAALTAEGMQVEILSGDAPGRVAAVADEVGVGEWRARQLPEGKLQRLADLRANGARVVVVGDGINDAPILAGADVAVAMASGADLAQASSDIVLASDSLEALPVAVRLSREALMILRQNQRWALAYNLGAVPLAVFGLVPPWLAALGMSVSSLLVVLNAMRIGHEEVHPRLPRLSRAGG